MESNQFCSKIIKQAERRLIEIPIHDIKKFKDMTGKHLKITLEEI